MEKRHSIIFLIKNKTIALIVLFLMKITAPFASVPGMVRRRKINYQHTKALLNLASAIHRFSIRLLRFISLPAL